MEKQLKCYISDMLSGVGLEGVYLVKTHFYVKVGLKRVKMRLNPRGSGIWSVKGVKNGMKKGQNRHFGVLGAQIRAENGPKRQFHYVSSFMGFLGKKTCFGVYYLSSKSDLLV